MQDKPNTKKTTILIIDDEKAVCVSLKFVLARIKNYEILTTTSPIEGIKLAEENHPDLILLDIIMPEMDGTEVATRLANNLSTKNIPIAFVSVLAEKQDLEDKGGIIGGHPFISKPVNIKSLLASIDSLLQETPTNN